MNEDTWERRPTSEELAEIRRRREERKRDDGWRDRMWGLDESHLLNEIDALRAEVAALKEEEPNP